MRANVDKKRFGKKCGLEISTIYVNKATPAREAMQCLEHNFAFFAENVDKKRFGKQ
jgi:hypothetical protein